MLAANTGLTHIELSEHVKTNRLYTSFDETYGSYVIDEDRVIDDLEPILANGGVVVDYHGSDFFPERWFDLVVVLQTDNTILYDRLEKRFVVFFRSHLFTQRKFIISHQRLSFGKNYRKY